MAAHIINLALCLVSIVLGPYHVLASFLLPLTVQEKHRLRFLGLLSLTVGLQEGIVLVLPYLHIEGEILFRITLFHALCYLLLTPFLLALAEEIEKIRGGYRRVLALFALAESLLLFFLFFFEILTPEFIMTAWQTNSIILFALCILSLPGTMGFLFPYQLAYLADCLLSRYEVTKSYAFILLFWITCSLILQSLGILRRSLQREIEMTKKLQEASRIRSYLMADKTHATAVVSSLSHIYYSCEEEPDVAMAKTKDLSTYLELFYSSIHKGIKHRFLDELSLLEHFLSLWDSQQEKLVVSYNTPHTIFNLPPFSLLSLVKLITEHGKPGQPDAKKELQIQTQKYKQFSEVSLLSNTPVFLMEDTNTAVHEGLERVRERLSSLCQGTLSVGSLPEEGSIVTLRIPKKAFYFLPDQTEDSFL